MAGAGAIALTGTARSVATGGAGSSTAGVSLGFFLKKLNIGNLVKSGSRAGKCVAESVAAVLAVQSAHSNRASTIHSSRKIAMPDTDRRLAAGDKAAKSHKTRSARARAPSSHQVRIIGGRWKRTLLPVVAALGLRPTPDRVRETVFNWLTHLFDNDWQHLRCLDLFAGSGALGFEAASRGAAAVTMIDAHTPAVRQLETVRDRLGAAEITIVRGDAQALAKSLIAEGTQSRFDLVFLDPPYCQGWLEKMLPLCAGLLAHGGYLYVETEAPLGEGESEATNNWYQGWTVVRADRAGMVFYHLLQRVKAGGLEA